MIRTISALAVMALVGAPWLVSDVVGTSLGKVTTTAADHRAPLRRVLLTPHAGPSRVATLDGVGCSEAICSRVGVRTRAAGRNDRVQTLVRFDAIAAIKLSEAGDATIDFVDGSSRQVVIPIENRVLYILDDSERTQRLNLRQLESVEFLR